MLGLLLFVSLALLLGLRCEAASLTNTSATPLGHEMRYVVEGPQRLSLAQALALEEQGRFRPVATPVPNFPLGSRPVWMHLEVDNPSATTGTAHLLAGMPWLEHMDVYVVRRGGVVAEWHTGVATPHAPGLTPSLGFDLPCRFEAGRSDVYLRVESLDPLVVPVRVLSEGQLVEMKRAIAYLVGGFGGFLIALCAYNLLLFLLVRERGPLYYSLNIASILFVILAYTGHGVAWLWPGDIALARYVIPVSTVVSACCGLAFASRVLRLEQHSLRLLRAVRSGALVGLAGVGICMAVGSHLGVNAIASVFVGAYALTMPLLGVLSIRRGVAAGRYFLGASICSALGVLTTDLTVSGKVPFTAVGYHGFEIGVILDAILWALALAHSMRQQQLAAIHAQHLARVDPLTALYNRRAFLELATPTWNGAVRQKRPLSIVVMDVDYFKRINDQHGHEAGDRTLVEAAALLSGLCRKTDIVARWGGEEFVVMLPGMDSAEASRFAERIRQAVLGMRVRTAAGPIALTASFGVAERVQQTNLQDLITAADRLLYEAKNLGRNRIAA
jgi:two-component system, sensor histidine kinase LadS